MHHKAQRLHSRQQGAILVTSIIMLLLMTIVAVTAVKLSILDILIAGNSQQRIILFQETETQLAEFAVTGNLANTLGSNGFEGNMDNLRYKFEEDSSRPNLTRTITNMEQKIYCERDGVASSIGPNAPPCDLYDFKLTAKKLGSSVVDTHYRGAGKMVPKSGSTANAIFNDVKMVD